MQPNEAVKDMIKWFRIIVNKLNSLTETMKNQEKTYKILRSLPIARWGPKVTAIEEAKDLRALTFDDQVGKLLTHEFTINSNTKQPLSLSKNVAFKEKMKEFPSNLEDGENEDDEEDHQFLLIRLARILKSKRSVTHKKKSILHILKLLEVSILFEKIIH